MSVCLCMRLICGHRAVKQNHSLFSIIHHETKRAWNNQAAVTLIAFPRAAYYHINGDQLVQKTFPSSESHVQVLSRDCINTHVCVKHPSAQRKDSCDAKNHNVCVCVCVCTSSETPTY